MHVLLRNLVVGLCVALLTACSAHGDHSAGSHPVDVLNRKARVWQYRDLDSASYYAQKAYDEICSKLKSGGVSLLYGIDNRWCKLKIYVIHMNYIGFKRVYNLHNFLFGLKGINYLKRI